MIKTPIQGSVQSFVRKSSKSANWPLMTHFGALWPHCGKGRTESDDKSLVCYYSVKGYRFFWIRPTLNCFDLFGIEYKILDFSRP